MTFPFLFVLSVLQRLHLPTGVCRQPRAQEQGFLGSQKCLEGRKQAQLILLVVAPSRWGGLRMFGEQISSPNGRLENMSQSQRCQQRVETTHDHSDAVFSSSLMNQQRRKVRKWENNFCSGPPWSPSLVPPTLWVPHLNYRCGTFTSKTRATR